MTNNNTTLFRNIITFQFRGTIPYSITLLLLVLGGSYIFWNQYVVFATMHASKIFDPALYLALFYWSELLLRALFQPTASLNLKPYLILNIPKLKLANLFYWISYINLINFIVVCFVISFAVFAWHLLPGSRVAWLLSCIAFSCIINLLFCVQKLIYPAFYYTMLILVTMGGLYYGLHKFTSLCQLFGSWSMTVGLWTLLIAMSHFSRKIIIKHLYIEQ